MPDGRYKMVYQTSTAAGVYEVHFIEIVDYDDCDVDIPDGVLTGVRPTLINQLGGCYDIAFDLVSNIENNTPFRRPTESDARGLSAIIEQCINKHYNAHKPYCYTFLAYNDLLARAYRIALLGIRARYPDRIKRIHSHLHPDGRGYAIELNTQKNAH